MRYFKWLLLILLASLAHAQQGNTVMIRFAGAPSGSCSPIAVAVNNATGAFYNCLASVWNLVGGAGGAVATVSGTANQIDSTGGATPVLSLSSTIIIPGTITSAAYATSGSNGGISGIEGTCAGLTIAAGSDLLCPNSTAHRWQFSNNNGAFDSIVGLATTDILVNKTLTTPTIASFTNAQHNHQDAAGGGTLTGSAIAPITTAGFFIPNYPGSAAMGAVASLMLAQNETDGLRFVASFTGTFTRITYQPTVSAGVGSHIGFAIYDTTGATRICTTGALDGTLTGAQTASLGSCALKINTDYIMIWTNDAATATTWTAQANLATGATVSNFMNPSGGTINFLKGTTGSSAGAPPSSLSTILTRATGNGVPYMFISP